MRAADILGALAIAALLTLPSALSELFAGVDDRSSEQLAARDEIAAARVEDRRNAAARAICAETHGENSAPVWRPDGSMRCATKRGHVIRTLSHYPERRL